MTPLRHRAFQTRIERIPAEEGEEVRLGLVGGGVAVVVYQGLEAGDAADGFG